MKELGLWIQNRWMEGSGDAWIPVIDPATEECVGRVPSATRADVETAVAAARDAFPAWRDLSADTRVDLLHRCAVRMREAAPDLAHTLTLETGRLRSRNQLYVEWSSRVFDYYAELARSERGRLLPSAEPDAQWNLVLKVPYGVVGCLVPWNYPILLLAWKLAPALAAGNTVVIKPASQTPLATLEMVSTAFSHLPPGVVNVVTGRGSETGDVLVRHPDVALVAFTGSTSVGQHLMSLAIPQVKPLHLELGGKDPAVVCADADLERVIPALTWGAFLNAGQVCTSVERIYAHRSVYERLVRELGASAGSLVLGPGMDPATQVTPMISASARRGLDELVQDAIARGARCVSGGGIPAQYPRGFYYRPTVLADCGPQLRIMEEETFGPAVTVTPFDTLEEAIALSNASPYGLGAGIYTRDPVAVHRFAHEVNAGTIWVNEPLVDNIAGPFGGMKQSGIGRELGPEGLESFRQTKHLHWDLGVRPKPWWFAPESGPTS